MKENHLNINVNTQKEDLLNWKKDLENNLSKNSFKKEELDFFDSDEPKEFISTQPSNEEKINENKGNENLKEETQEIIIVVEKKKNKKNKKRKLKFWLHLYMSHHQESIYIQLYLLQDFQINQRIIEKHLNRKLISIKKIMKAMIIGEKKKKLLLIIIALIQMIKKI